MVVLSCCPRSSSSASILGALPSPLRHKPKQPLKLDDVADALWGAKSLTERFGSLTGRELQDKVFEIYQAGLLIGCLLYLPPTTR